MENIFELLITSTHHKEIVPKELFLQNLKDISIDALKLLNLLSPQDSINFIIDGIVVARYFQDDIIASLSKDPIAIIKLIESFPEYLELQNALHFIQGNWSLLSDNNLNYSYLKFKDTFKQNLFSVDHIHNFEIESSSFVNNCLVLNLKQIKTKKVHRQIYEFNDLESYCLFIRLDSYIFLKFNTLDNRY